MSPETSGERALVIGRVLEAAMWAICIAFVAWCAKEALVAYAGTTTIVDVHGRVVGRIAGDVQVDSNAATALVAELGAWRAALWPLLFGAQVFVGSLWYNFMRKKVADLTERNRMLELSVNPGRTTSGLEPSGATAKQDRRL